MKWAECCLQYCSKEKVLINNPEVSNEDHTMWLNSDLMNELFKELEGK